MHVSLIQEGGVGALAAFALGALGCALGVLAMVALLGRSRAAFTLGVATLVLSIAAAGAGMAGTLYARHQTDRALSFVGSRVDRERIHRAGYRESQSSSWVGLSAALVLLALGGVGALLGSRLKKPQSRLQGFMEPVVAADETMGPSVIAGGFMSLAGVACVGAWMMAHLGLPEGRYGFDDADVDSWSLAVALDDVTEKKERGCERLASALEPFWGATNKREWPRKMRREVSAKLAWRSAADGCAKDILDALDGRGSSWTREGLLDSALLQDEGLHQRALTAARAPDEDEVGSGGLPKEEIHRTVRADMAEIKRCYESALASEPTLEGTLRVEFVIGPDGKVLSAEADSENTFSSEKVTNCVLARFRKMRFPKVNGGGEVTVKYPFIFKAG